MRWNFSCWRNRRARWYNYERLRRVGSQQRPTKTNCLYYILLTLTKLVKVDHESFKILLASVLSLFLSTCLNWIFWVVDILWVDFEIRELQIHFQVSFVALDRRSTIVYIGNDRTCKVLIQLQRYLQFKRLIDETFFMNYIIWQITSKQTYICNDDGNTRNDERHHGWYKSHFRRKRRYTKRICHVCPIYFSVLYRIFVLYYDFYEMIWFV